MKLLTIEETPEWLATNKNLVYGYRTCKNYIECIYSIKYWSISQWSSLTSLFHTCIGICMFGLLCYYRIDNISLKQSLFALSINAIVGGSFSSSYHIFGESAGMNEDVAIFFRNLDFIGIHFSSVFIGFALSSSVEYMYPEYHLMVEITSTITITLLLTSFYIASKINSIMCRVASLGITICGYSLSLYIVFMKHGIYSLIGMTAFMMLFCVLIGAVIYIYQFPECIIKYNIVGSHAFMHLFITISFIFKILFVVKSHIYKDTLQSNERTPVCEPLNENGMK
jgi:hypothetical protein